MKSGQNTAPEVYTIPEGATENLRVSFTEVLRAGELLDGTTGASTLTITEETTTDLTITSKIFNASTIAIGDESAVLAGQALTFTVAGQLEANTPYRIIMTVHTDAGQTLRKYCHIKCANK